MNKISNKTVTFALLSALTLTSCGDDFLDKNPKLSVTETDIYASESLIDARWQVSIVVSRAAVLPVVILPSSTITVATTMSIPVITPMPIPILII